MPIERTFKDAPLGGNCGETMELEGRECSSDYARLPSAARLTVRIYYTERLK